MTENSMSTPRTSRQTERNWLQEAQCQTRSRLQIRQLSLFCITLFLLSAAKGEESTDLLNEDVVGRPPGQLETTLDNSPAEDQWPPDDHPNDSSFEHHYVNGKQAYLDNRWPECIEHISTAIRLHKEERRKALQCRRRCHRHADFAQLVSRDDEHRFFEKTIRNTLCLMRCGRGVDINSREHVASSTEIAEEMAKGTPYDYLQLCYYKVNDLANAASCAYTFLLSNPDHQIMKDNFKFYASKPEVDLDKVENLEIQLYQELFLKGNEAHNNKNYKEVVESMELALKHYYEAEEECRLSCEGTFDKAPALDLTMTIANHFTYSLRCKQKCSKNLAHLHGQNYEDFLPTHYHYLQYAYFQIGDLVKACEAVANYLLFHPNNEMMLHNKDYYLNAKAEELKTTHFTPTKEVVDYVTRDGDEKRLLAFIEENFTSTVTTTDSNESDQLDIQKATPIPETSILLTEHQLNGTQRFATDGFATEDECQRLISLASDAAVHGDGYNGKKSPHTEFETFEGVTIGRVAVLVKLDLLPTSGLKLLLDISEKGRLYVEKYFGLEPDKLYFSYTHLVCRTARDDAPLNRSDLSHPVHADNCVLTKDGRCTKEKPAFTWRDYSAIIYLNSDFEGGEFIFAADKANVQASVRPTCGRIVGFSAGQENLHGVKAVLKGKRCALAMWFTLDHDHREKERFLATQVLQQLESKGDAKYASENLPETTEENAADKPEQQDRDVEVISEFNAYQLGKNNGFPTKLKNDRTEL